MADYSSKYKVVMLLLLALVITSEHVASGDVDKDREKCGNQLVGLATCLPYVSGDSISPAPDCCTGLGTLLRTSPQCLCLLVKDRNDPSLGLNINATRAMALPSYCHAPANISACPTNSSSENARTATNAGESNGGKMRKRWIGGIEM
ncbi:lipid-transfer protein, partial [Striga asiatica]